MPKVLNLTKYDDSGHGWLKVPIRTLEELEIEDQITSSSYERGPNAYLEEDQDMTTFMEAAEAKGWDVQVRTVNDGDRSKIRSYDSYVA